MAARGRKSDFSDEALVGFLKDYAQQNPFKKISYSAAADYINMTRNPPKKLDYRHFSKSGKAREFVDTYNARLLESTRSLPVNGNPFLEQDIDVGAMAAQCITAGKVRDVIRQFADASAAYPEEIARLSAACDAMHKRAKGAEANLAKARKQTLQRPGTSWGHRPGRWSLSGT